ncbi:MAG TPA: hypothetical protein ACQGQH_10290 [Xylella sp.]
MFNFNDGEMDVVNAVLLVVDDDGIFLLLRDGMGTLGHLQVIG